jgi:hypothetical protein
LAYQNFKQTFWSKHIQHELAKKAILADFCNRQFEGEAKFGNQVKILGVGRPTIGNYTGASIGTPETVEDSSVFLPIDKAKYFNFMVDDVDKAQSKPGLMEALMEEATLAMALQIDSDIAEVAALNGGTTSNSTQINTAATAKTAIDTGILTLRENDVPLDADVVMEIPPFVYQLLKDKYIDLDTDNSEMVKKGIMGRYDGVKVRVSNNLYKSGDDWYCLIRTKKAVAYVNQIDKVEPYRPEGLFSDAIKGLNVYGAKVVRPKELYVLRAKK